MREPLIRIGISEGKPMARVKLHGPFRYRNKIWDAAGITVTHNNGFIIADLPSAQKRLKIRRLRLTPAGDSTFSLSGVKIGIGFHWERDEEQTFGGSLELTAETGGITVVNEIRMEEYLKSVISSEMSAAAPLEFLKAHAIASRSWLGSMLAKKRKPHEKFYPDGPDHIRWYDREDHGRFDVCADDHCQRYQGISKIISGNAARAVAETGGTFLVYGGHVCDARFYKACGGITENFSSAWEDANIAYLSSVSDSEVRHAPVAGETGAERWIASNPDAFCNTNDGDLLGRILPDFDQGTGFFRWTVEYTREELEEIIRRKSGMDFGTLESLVPLQRGPSGRIVRLRITGSIKTLVIGKELEIRKWLSPTHLLSSAFIVEVLEGKDGKPSRFTLKGAGWGHGVGMCQIGAAVMASRGYRADQILKHYFPGASLKKLYQAG